MKRRIIAGLIGALVLAAPAVGETLKLGNEGIYPPFSILDSTGKLTGVEPDLAREMCKRMGVECELVVMEYKALIPSLLQGKLDAVVSQTAPTAERKERVLFSPVIVKNLFTFVAPKSSNYTYTRDGLKGVKIGSQRGGATGKYIVDNFTGSAVVMLYDNPDQIKLELLNGRIDVAFGPNLNWKLELIEKPEGKDWKLTGGEYWVGDPATPPDQQGSSWITRKSDGEALIKRMSAALDAMIADCTFTKIRAQYVSFPIMPGDARCAAKPAG
jgi:ABC-type amino acid transport substrate-binding protein